MTNTKNTVAAGDTVSYKGETFTVFEVKSFYNYRAYRSEPYVFCKGLLWPVATLEGANGAWVAR